MKLNKITKSIERSYGNYIVSAFGRKTVKEICVKRASPCSRTSIRSLSAVAFGNFACIIFSSQCKAQLKQSLHHKKEVTANKYCTELKSYRQRSAVGQRELKIAPKYQRANENRFENCMHSRTHNNLPVYWNVIFQQCLCVIWLFGANILHVLALVSSSSLGVCEAEREREGARSLYSLRMSQREILLIIFAYTSDWDMCVRNTAKVAEVEIST